MKNSLVAKAGPAALCRLVMLFCREKAGWPTGILPLAFSDIPLTWDGTESSTDDAIDALLEAPDCDGTGDLDGSEGRASSASESSSSSPIAKALSSSGTFPKVGVRATVGLRRLSIELVRVRSSPPSLRCWFCRSISSCPLSKVKSLSAWNLFRDRTIAYTRLGLCWY